MCASTATKVVSENAFNCRMMENPNQSALNLNAYWLTFWKSKAGMDFRASVIKMTD